MSEVHVAPTPSIVERLVGEIRSAAAGAIAARGLFSIAVPGGSVATECFPSLAAVPVPWEKVHVFWVDERAVPPSDPESNYAVADRLWLSPARIDAAQVHRMPGEREDLETAADAYAFELARVLGPLPSLDVALLGMGPDGHVASLFPGHPVLAERARLVAAVADAPKPPPRRLTLTMPVLAHARRVIVVAFGASKAAALAEALHDPGSPLPVAHLLRLAPTSLVLADPAAAP